MNLGGRGFPIQEENGIVRNRAPWIPSIPGTPTPPRSEVVPVRMQVNEPDKGNWRELLGMYSEFLLDTPDSVEAVRNFDSENRWSQNREETNLSSSRKSSFPATSFSPTQVQNFDPQIEGNGRNQFFESSGMESNSIIHQRVRSNMKSFPSVEFQGFYQTELVTANGCNQSWDAGGRERNSISGKNESSYSNNFMFEEVQNFAPNEASTNGWYPNKDQYSNCNENYYADNYRDDPTNWPNGLLEEIVGVKKSSGNITYASGVQSTNIHVRNRAFNNLCTQMKGPESNSTSQVLEKQIPAFCSNQNIIGYKLQQLPPAGSPVHCRPDYNLNSPPRLPADAASSVSNSFHFLPLTPDQKHLEDSFASENLNLPIENIPVLEISRQEIPIVVIRSEDMDNRCTQLLQTIVESSSSAISTAQKEQRNEGDEQGIDLNRTPHQKTQKRKKHRPKVIKERKSTRTPKPKATQNTTSTCTPSAKDATLKANGVNELNTVVTPGSTGKRKYVRKNGVTISEHLQENTINGGMKVSSVEPAAAKSCRKQLNFDLVGENKTEIQENKTENEKNNEGFSFNLNFCPKDTETTITGMYKNISPLQMEQQKVHTFRTSELLGFTTHMPTGNPLLVEQIFPSTPLARAKDHTMNVIARNVTLRNQDSQLNPNAQRMGNEHVGSQADASCTNLDRSRELNFQTNSQAITKNVANFVENRGHKRHSIEQMHPQTTNAMGSSFMYQKISGSFDSNTKLSNLGGISFENHKKKRTRNGLKDTVSFVGPFSVAATKDGSNHEERREKNGVYTNNSILQLLNFYFGRENVSHRTISHPMLSQQNFQKQQHVSSEMQKQTQRMTEKRFDGSNQAHVAKILSAVVDRNQLHASKPKDTRRSDCLHEAYNGNSLEQNQILHGKEIVLHQQPNSDSSHPRQSSTKAKGQAKNKKFQDVVDEITYCMEFLNIYGVTKDQQALVPYKGEVAIVAYEPIKKRKPRPKVDLDPETDRLWRLLMGKQGSEGEEPIDIDKEKWWDNEREVFRGRVDSFIARMHLVQGDRRFSRWKGSVVDSVIGVFLTQNVSDHLSSSAFMSLASKYPLRSTNPREKGAPILVEEPEIHTLEPTGRINFNKKISQNSIVCCEVSEQSQNLPFWMRSAVNEQNIILGEEIVSSQDSVDSQVFQITDEIRSSSGSNSEAEDLTAGCKPHKNIVPATSGVLNAGQDSVFNGAYGHVNISSFEFSEHDGQNPVWKGANNLNLSSRLNGSISLNFQHTQESHASSTNYKSGSQIGCSQQNHIDDDHQEVSKSVLVKENTGKQQSECSKFKGVALNTEAAFSVNSKQNNFETPVVDTNPKKQNGSSFDPNFRTNTNVLKAKKGKSKEEKKTAFNWDSLRRNAQSDCKVKERSNDTLDSLDYEALRCANVNEISDTIRERGMNNMLAERIKDFLNRLVTDHGSIDLEWLREVPPDKAKDYLLSIRGLGLKSVECVRLLTLHHLAFPVDTNVGRIAVRLGWVPLQPLPESLQLHLLELYPVLESIQKYLWPRLCKLDQLTLYELHYQMITFGKVFCTKSKPNCNACPMRAECRHFASAFASARLALPGPEEKNTASSLVSVEADKNQPVLVKPVPLLPAGNNDNKERRLFERYCEPIVEEPATPEPETPEVSISDIEDAFFADPEEIPMIKLNMEEFASNLQNLMQDNMELQGDMSKALVALNPEAASIPAPKLKNISRLRTEHQVYELPDSHPLLNGMDKREPDDPSPYLLAIWTPGETANSTQLPERTCCAQESGNLCDDQMCFSCSSIREANSQTVRGTLLIPCRTAMRGSFPLNGTYFQVNEMFADHESSLNPIDVPRGWLWNLPRRTVYFGTSVSTIFKGLTTEGIQYCFWRGFVCVRGFDKKTRAPRPLMARLHFPASKLVKPKNEGK